MGLIVCSQQGHFAELEQRGGRLLAWIRDQVRLKAFSAHLGAFIYRRRHSLMLNWEQ
jgi:hypothetical protein